MRETRLSGSEGGGAIQLSLPLSRRSSWSLNPSATPCSSESTRITGVRLEPRMNAALLTCLLPSGIYYVVVYIEASAFTRRLHQLAGASALDVLRSIQDDLLKNPARGNLVQGLAGIRKERCTNPGRTKGKRGGYRYLFLYLEHRDHIHLLYLLDKDEQEDLSNDERRLLRALAIRIKETEQG